jgi:hypothetical protein
MWLVRLLWTHGRLVPHYCFALSVPLWLAFGNAARAGSFEVLFDGLAAVCTVLAVYGLAKEWWHR